MTSPQFSPAGKAEDRGNTTDKRSHPAPRRPPGVPFDAAAAFVAAAAGMPGKPVISHLAKSGRFSAVGPRGSNIMLALPDADDYGCRALVPYTASPPARGPAVSFPAPPPLLALPASLASGDLSPSSPCRASPGGVGAGEAVAHRLDIPLEVFPIVFQYMDAPTLCSVSSVSREWRRQGNDDQYWRRLCRARFNVTPDAFAPPPDPIKRLYQLQHGSFKEMRRGCRDGFHTALPSISRNTSAQLLGLMMMSNAM
eukprot:g9016.t1